MSTSFEELLQQKGGDQVQAAWNNIQAQMQAEGEAQGIDPATLSLNMGAAQSTLADAYSQLTSGFQADASTALAAASQFTLVAKTVSGAVDTVNKLSQAFNNAQTPAETEAAVNMMIGTIVAAATAAGVLSTGYGAIVVAAVAIIVKLADALGAFGEPFNAVGSLCGYDLGQQPSITVGCVYAVGAPPVSIKAQNWRRFPLLDPGWFQNIHLTKGAFWVGPLSFPWAGGLWTALTSSYVVANGRLETGRVTLRPIDFAYPEFYYIERPKLPAGAPPIVVDFYNSFLATWMGNAEYALNGIKPQDDLTMLVQFTTVWNIAHSDSSTFDIGPGDIWDANYSAVKNIPFRFQNDSPAYSIYGGKLRINTGPRKASYSQVGALSAATQAAAAAVFSGLAKIFPGMSLVQITTALPAMKKTGVAPAVWNTLTPAEQTQMKASGLSEQESTAMKIAKGVAITVGVAGAGVLVYSWYAGLSLGAVASKTLVLFEPRQRR